MPQERDPNELGALWEKTSAKGVVYLAGKIDGKNIVCFRNKEKKTDKHPDWRVLLSKPKDSQPAPNERDEF